MATLSKYELDMGLRRLGELAVSRGIEIELAIVGGAAMVLGVRGSRGNPRRGRHHPLTGRSDRPAAGCRRWPTSSANTLVVAAALLELLALRSGAEPAAWTRETGPAREPIHLVRAAATMPRTRARVEAESPEPLRKRNVFAPAEYATFV